MNQCYTEDQTEIIQSLDRLRAEAERGTLKQGEIILKYNDGSRVLLTFAEDEPLRISKIELSG